MSTYRMHPLLAIERDHRKKQRVRVLLQAVVLLLAVVEVLLVAVDIELVVLAAVLAAACACASVVFAAGVLSRL